MNKAQAITRADNTIDRYIRALTKARERFETEMSELQKATSVLPDDEQFSVASYIAVEVTRKGKVLAG